MSELLSKAHSVLLPVLLDLKIGDDIRRFLSSGGSSLLFGETPDEYKSGQMSSHRREIETNEKWRDALAEAKGYAGPLLVAADADISAVHRLQGLVPPLPDRMQAEALDSAQLEELCFHMALGVKATGVTLVLSPTADVVKDANAWLKGRTLSDDLVRATEMVQAYVRGVRRAGVGATVKHFPGNPTLATNPTETESAIALSLDELSPYLAPFRAGIDLGVEAVLMGPTIFSRLNPPVAASRSPALIALLRNELAFNGLVITFDIDNVSVMQQLALGDVAVEALSAGADLLLLSAKAVPFIPEIAQAIVAALKSGRLSEQRLDEAAKRVAHSTTTLSEGQ